MGLVQYSNLRPHCQWTQSQPSLIIVIVVVVVVIITTTTTTHHHHHRYIEVSQNISVSMN
jgi:hypothetical protein